MKDRYMSENSLAVSFAIPTLNAALFLPKCLKSIKEQDYPKDLVEIVVADGGSTDNTRDIAANYGAKVINNPGRLFSSGRVLAFEKSQGEIVFFCDSDNVLPHKNWLKLMVKPFLENTRVMGCFTQTIPPLDTNSLDKYMAYLYTDPFSWFVYGCGADPRGYSRYYDIEVSTKDYIIYKFSVKNFPLVGLAQGFGVKRSFKGDKNDDILPVIEMIRDGWKVAYAPKAGIYHYHAQGYGAFLRKYRWRVRNNLMQQYKKIGFSKRVSFLSKMRRLRTFFFPFYSLSLILPFLDGLRLSVVKRTSVMLWHCPACVGLGLGILIEVIKQHAGMNRSVGEYPK